jgi:hypothetical protein
MADVIVAPYLVSPGEGVTATSVTAPNGNVLDVTYGQEANNGGGTPAIINWFQEMTSTGGTQFNTGGILVGTTSGSSAYLYVQSKNQSAVAPNGYGDKFTVFWEKDYDPTPKTC